MIKIFASDKKFTDSPDAGPDCKCSRCGLPIYEQEGPPIRAWPEDATGEYRYHPACLVMVSA